MNSTLGHDQDFMARNWTEYRIEDGVIPTMLELSAIADVQGPPGSCSIF